MSTFYLQYPENCAYEDKNAAEVTGEHNHQYTDDQNNEEFILLPKV